MSIQWVECKLESVLKESLLEAFPNDSSKRESIYSDYVKVREKALEIAKNIASKETTLTDHSPEHIANVMNNAYQLVKDNLHTFNYAELYFLCVIIMLHDVGNIEGRANHQNKVVNIYNEIRGNNSHFYNERSLALKAISAHSGELKKGDKDTLIYLSESSDLIGNKLKLRELSSILRFADELAEGPQRTCDYLINNNTYQKTNEGGDIDHSIEIYHVYAQTVNIHIDNDEQRISVAFNIDISSPKIKEITLNKLLLFIYSRILKMDEERRYCKYYANILNPFKKTSVVFNINNEGAPIDIEIPNISLEDKFNLSLNKEGNLEDLFKRYPALKIDSILDQIQKTQYERSN